LFLFLFLCLFCSVLFCSVLLWGPQRCWVQVPLEKLPWGP
jgi:hypothetical protein